MHIQLVIINDICINNSKIINNFYNFVPNVNTSFIFWWWQLIINFDFLKLAHEFPLSPRKCMDAVWWIMNPEKQRNLSRENGGRNTFGYLFVYTESLEWIIIFMKIWTCICFRSQTYNIIMASNFFKHGFKSEFTL